MRYFKAKKVVDELTTKSFSQINDKDKIYRYEEKDGVEYLGVDSADIPTLLKAQPVELEVKELTYDEIKPVLDDCRLMKDFNAIVEKEIAEKYSVGREFKMLNLAATDQERLDYEAFKEAVKAPVRLLKKDMGLVA